MNWEAIGAITGLVGIALVIVSLLFVGIQVRQSNKDAKSLSRQNLIDTFSLLNWELAQNPDLLRIIAAGIDQWSSLSNMEKTRFETVMGRYLQNLQKGILQHKEDTLDEATLDNIADFMIMCVQLPGGREWYEQSAWPSQEVRAYISQRLSTPETLPPQLDQAVPHWMALADESRDA